MTEPCHLPLTRIVGEMEAQRLTSEALVTSCLARISEREPVVNAWDFLDPELALAQARARDREPRRSPLHGIPVGVKDVIDVAGMPAAWGDKATYGHRRPERDAPIVQLLRELGAVILGKTAVSRFGFWWPGKARNPHDPTRTPGSSSSGSAAAVADFMCPISIGTQTAGSIMRPAAFCGIAGVMPTHDWIAWRGSRDFSPTFDRAGFYTRTMSEAALVHEVLTGVPSPAPADRPLRVGLHRTHQWGEAKPYVRDHFEGVARRLAAAGHVVEELDLPAAYDRLYDAQHVLNGYETSRSFAWELEHARTTMPPEIHGYLGDGLAHTRADYLEAMALMVDLRERFPSDLGAFDLMMVPGSEGEAPPASGVGGNLFIRQWMMLHTPVIGAPAGRGPAGLPLGVQFVGRRFDDAAFVANVARLARHVG